MVKRVRRSNVKDGVLLPLGNGFSLVKGDNPNKVDDVDIGPNNKNGLSVNHGEILQQQGNTLRVFSAEPMLGGVSPVQLLYGGMAPDKVFAMQEQYKDIHGINDDGSRQHAQFGLFKRIKEKLSGKSNNSNTQTPVKEPEYVSYFDATDEQKSNLIDKKGKYNIQSVGDYGDTHFSVIEARYKSLTDSMKRKGFTSEEIDRLSPFLITQQVLEGGYKLSNDTNNFGGLLVSGTNKKMSFKSVDEFNDYYLSNLDEKWGDDYLGKGKGWRNAKTLKEYADTINREDLRLYTKEAHSEYNRQHKDKPAYIYTPLWENNNTGLMSEPKFGGIYPRVSGMIDLLKTRIEDWNNIAKTNNIIKKQFGGNVDLKNLINRINTTSNADFVKRLKDPNRKYIKKGNTIYTHLLSYATNGDKAIVYPEVQNTDKGLKIFKGREALDRAIEQRDTLHMSIPEAEAFTTQYKHYYPGFKYGGQTKINPLGERSNAKFGKEMSNPVKKVNKYFERKSEEENPKMSFPEKLQKDYEQLMSPPSVETIEKIFKGIYKEKPKRTLKERLKRGLYNKYKLNNINPQIDSSYLLNQYTLNDDNSENKRNKALYGLDGDGDNILLNPSIIIADGRKIRKINRRGVSGPKLGLTVPDLPQYDNLNPSSITASGRTLNPSYINNQVVGPKLGLTVPDLPQYDNLNPSVVTANGKPINTRNINSKVTTPNIRLAVPETIPNQYKDLNPVTVTASGRPFGPVDLPSQVTTPTISPRNPFNAPKAITAPTLANSVTDKYGTITGTNGQVTSIKTPETPGLKVPAITPKTSKSSGLSAIGADLIGAGINAAGSLIAAGINQNAINNQKFTPRQYNLLNPVKLKTKININPQLGQMRETVAQINDSIRRNSASSRSVRSGIADTRLKGLSSMMGLYGDKENKETQLINQDKLNQQQIAAQNSNRVMETVNYNITGKDALANRKEMLTAQNWINPVNVIAGSIAGPQGLLARRDARIRDANNLTIATLPYLKEFDSLSKDDFVRRHGKTIYNAITNGKSLIG